jgi:hypothetical protein
VDFSRLTNVLPAIPESRFHIKNKWFEAWPRWNHWLVLAEAPASAYWTSPSKTRFYNMVGKEDQSRKAVFQSIANLVLSLTQGGLFATAYGKLKHWFCDLGHMAAANSRLRSKCKRVDLCFSNSHFRSEPCPA